MSRIRLQKYLAECGLASRRKAEELIRQGKVSVNGNIVVTLGTKVCQQDKILVEGREISNSEKKIYVMLNKPKGYVTTVKDQFCRKTVMDLVSGIKERIYPVGRLDYDTSGLLLLTNDGDLTYSLTHPGHEIDKVYIAVIKGLIGKDDIEKFKNGIWIESYKTSPASLSVIKKYKDRCKIEIVIHEGKNRQVRKMCDAIGHPVIDLKRVAIGKLVLGRLEVGKWRFLDDKELKLLNY